MGSGAGCTRQQRTGDQLGTGAAEKRELAPGLPGSGSPSPGSLVQSSQIGSSSGTARELWELHGCPNEPGPLLPSPCGSTSCPQMLGPPVRAPKFTSGPKTGPVNMLLHEAKES